MTTTIHEPSAWLRSMAARRLRYPDMENVHNITARGTRVLAYLVPPESSADRQAWDRRCDRCRRQCPKGEPFHTAMYEPCPGVALAFGLCPVCCEREGGETE